MMTNTSPQLRIYVEPPQSPQGRKKHSKADHLCDGDMIVKSRDQYFHFADIFRHIQQLRASYRRYKRLRVGHSQVLFPNSGALDRLARRSHATLNRLPAIDQCRRPKSDLDVLAP
jgi:hypothetical protein